MSMGQLAMHVASLSGEIAKIMTRGALLRTVMLNHWYHHRAQLTV